LVVNGIRRAALATSILRRLTPQWQKQAAHHRIQMLISLCLSLARTRFAMLRLFPAPLIIINCPPLCVGRRAELSALLLWTEKRVQREESDPLSAPVVCFSFFWRQWFHDRRNFMQIFVIKNIKIVNLNWYLWANICILNLWEKIINCLWIFNSFKKSLYINLNLYDLRLTIGFQA